MHQFKTLKKSENFSINLVNSKTFKTGFNVLLVSIVREAFATKRKNMYFLLLVFVNFLFCMSLFCCNYRK